MILELCRQNVLASLFYGARAGECDLAKFSLPLRRAQRGTTERKEGQFGAHLTVAVIWWGFRCFSFKEIMFTGKVRVNKSGG